MDLKRKILGPKSKYIDGIPYTYEARVDILKGSAGEPVYNYYYSDTVCGLIEYLDKENIDPEDAEIF